MLAYTQTLIQQMDNRQHLIDWQASQPKSAGAVSSCCGQELSADQAAATSLTTPPPEDEDPNALRNWFNCMWTSAKACQHLSQVGSGKLSHSSWSQRLLELLGDGLAQLSVSFLLTLRHIYAFIHNALAWFGLARLLWLARWRSPIVQRLIQSMLVQVYYIGNLLLATDYEQALSHRD